VSRLSLKPEQIPRDDSHYQSPEDELINADLL
jgi:hypothetical protein